MWFNPELYRPFMSLFTVNSNKVTWGDVHVLDSAVLPVRCLGRGQTTLKIKRPEGTESGTVLEFLITFPWVERTSLCSYFYNRNSSLPPLSRVHSKESYSPFYCQRCVPLLSKCCIVYGVKEKNKLQGTSATLGIIYSSWIRFNSISFNNNSKYIQYCVEVRVRRSNDHTYTFVSVLDPMWVYVTYEQLEKVQFEGKNSFCKLKWLQFKVTSLCT